MDNIRFDVGNSINKMIEIFVIICNLLLSNINGNNSLIDIFLYLKLNKF